jgi:hypothetical protein
MFSHIGPLTSSTKGVIMAKVSAILLILIAAMFAGCVQTDLPPGVLEFEAPAGNFRVVTPEDWVETPELGGFTAVESPDLDLVFGVISVDPISQQMSSYSNPREYEVNGRQITVYDGPSGRRTPELYFGIEYYPDEAFHAVVTTGERLYHVILIRSTTVEPHDDHEQIFVDLAASLESVP